MARTITYFVSDTHLGLDHKDPSDREARFVRFLRGIPTDTTENLILLGDIWDFWYEYRDVVPKGYIRVLVALMDLVEAGVKVYFFQGNHDIWTYSYFESLGIIPLKQPYVMNIGGRNFCMGHGDGLGPVPKSYLFMRAAFHNRAMQRFFSSLHPTLAFRLGIWWSRRSRFSHKEKYVFDPSRAPIVEFAENFKHDPQPDFFIFGHYHVSVDYTLSTGARLLMTKDWFEDSTYLRFDATSGLISVCEGHSQKSE